MNNYFEDMFKNIDPSIKLDNKQINIIKCKEKKQMIIAGALNKII